MIRSLTVCGFGFAIALNSLAISAAYSTDKSVLEQVRHIISTEFFDKDQRKTFDIMATKLAKRTELLSSEPAESIDYGTEIQNELGSLNASHTARYVADSIDYYELMDTYSPAGIGDEVRKIFRPDGKVSYAGIGMIPTNIDGKTFVSHVYQGSSAASGDIRVGDQILSVNGHPYAPIASFKGKAGREVTLELRRKADGQPIERKVRVEDIQPGTQLVNAIKTSAGIIERDGVKIGYVRLWTFARPEVQSIVKNLLSDGSLAGSNALVLDLRSRWGGAPPNAAEMFVNQAATMEMIGPNGEKIVPTAEKDPAAFRWNKPVVALIDQGTRSGMEVLAYNLKKAGVTLVGSNTAGAVLGGRPFVLKDTSLLLLAVMDVHVDGKRLEGRGVAPNISVPIELPFSAGKDPQLETAVDEAVRRAS